MQTGIRFAVLGLVVVIGATWFLATFDGLVTSSRVIGHSYTETVETVQVDGTDYAISGPYSHENLAVFLVFGEPETLPGRKVLTLGEALEQGKARVYETGDVQELAIENLTDDTEIFVQCGDILRGGQQDRVIAADLLVAAASARVPLPTFCVEQGRWGQRFDEPTARFDELAGGMELMNRSEVVTQYDSNPVADAFASGGLFSLSRNSISSRETKHAVCAYRSQEQVWHEVSRTQAALSSKLGDDAVSFVSSSSLELTLGSEKVQSAIAKFKEALGSLLEDKAKVRGYVFAINQRIDSGEVYASDALVRRMWLKMLQASAVEALAKTDERRGKSRVTEEDVRRFLTVARDTTATGREFSSRVRQVTAVGDGKVFSESRGGASKLDWIHRSYVAK